MLYVAEQYRRTEFCGQCFQRRFYFVAEFGLLHHPFGVVGAVRQFQAQDAAVAAFDTAFDGQGFFVLIFSHIIDELRIRDSVQPRTKRARWVIRVIRVVRTQKCILRQRASLPHCDGALSMVLKPSLFAPLQRSSGG